MRRTLLAAATLATATAVLLPTAALARPPEQERIEFSINDRISGVCDFTIVAHVELKITNRTFLDAEGNPTGGSSTGSIKAWLTNANTGKIVRFVIPGPAFFQTDGAVTGAGPWVTFTADGRFMYITGRMTFNRHAEAVTWRGLARDVCDVLA